MIPIIINNRNRLVSTKKLVVYLRQLPDSKIIIVDNDSTYPPLLEWYNTLSDVKTIRLKENIGPYAPWKCCRKLQNIFFYVVTDSDLDLSEVPLDVLSKLKEGLDQFPQASKAGLSLEIEDIPKEFSYQNSVQQWELQFWSKKLTSEWWLAPIDTTFAMYRPGVQFGSIYNAIRADRPYTAKHLPWYLTSETATSEDVYYTKHCENNFSTYAYQTRLPIVSTNKNKDVKTSIVLSTYNKPNYLKRTLDSIFSQHPPFDFEVIVIDDGSPEVFTSEICRTYPVRYLRINRPEGFRNPASARNTGYLIAKGQIIIPQSDDVIHKEADTIERLINELRPKEFLIANVFNVHSESLEPEQNPTYEFTGIHNPRPFFFLGSMWRNDLYAIRGNDEEFTAPGYEDNWFADCLIHGRKLSPRFADIVGLHQNHPHSQIDMEPSRQLYLKKKQSAMKGDIPWEASITRVTQENLLARRV